jgi:hypothetical protein
VILNRQEVEVIVRAVFPAFEGWEVAEWDQDEFRIAAENFHMIGSEDVEILPKLLLALLGTELDYDWGLILDDLAIVLDVEAHGQHEYARKLKEERHANWTVQQSYAIFVWLEFMAQKLGRLQGKKASDEHWANAIHYWAKRGRGTPKV